MHAGKRPIATEFNPAPFQEHVMRNPDWRAAAGPKGWELQRTELRHEHADIHGVRYECLELGKFPTSVH